MTCMKCSSFTETSFTQTSSSQGRETRSLSEMFRSTPHCESSCERWTGLCWDGSWWCLVSASWQGTGPLGPRLAGCWSCLPWLHQTPDDLKICGENISWLTIHWNDYYLIAMLMMCTQCVFRTQDRSKYCFVIINIHKQSTLDWEFLF